MGVLIKSPDLWRSYGVGDTVWVINRLCPGKGAEHIKEGDCSLIQVKIASARIYGYVLNRKGTRHRVVIQYDFEGNWPRYSEHKDVYKLLREAIIEVEFRGGRVANIWKLKDRLANKGPRWLTLKKGKLK
jgi:hypothetical protein